MSLPQSHVPHQAVLVEFATPSALTGLLRRRSVALLPVGEQMIVEHWARHLRSVGVRTLLVVASRFPQQLRELLGNGERWGFDRIDYLATGSLSGWDDVQALMPGVDLAEVTCVDLATLPWAVNKPVTSVTDYWQANMDYLARLDMTLRAPGVSVHPQARLEGHCCLGADVVVGRGTTIAGSVIAGLVDVGEDTLVRDSVVLFDSRIGMLLNLDQVVVDGNYVFDIRRGTELVLNEPALLATIRHQGARISLAERALAVVLGMLTLPVWPANTPGGEADADAILSCRQRLPWLKEVIRGSRPLWGARRVDNDSPQATFPGTLPGVICLADFAGEDELAKMLADNYPVTALSLPARLSLVLRWLALVWTSRSAEPAGERKLSLDSRQV